MSSMVSEGAIERWQGFWRRLLGMAYERSNITDQLFAESCGEDSQNLNIWKLHYKAEFLTFEYMWKKYSQRRDENGNYIQPLVVPELKFLYVPFHLFQCVGVDSFMKHCFPNCTVSYWESGE